MVKCLKSKSEKYVWNDLILKFYIWLYKERMSDIIHTKCLIVGISENRNRRVSGGGFYDVLHISL